MTASRHNSQMSSGPTRGVNGTPRRPALPAGSIIERFTGIHEFLRALFTLCQEAARVFEVVVCPKPFFALAVHGSNHERVRRFCPTRDVPILTPKLLRSV